MGNLLNLAIYNPSLLSDEDFIASFVARNKVAKRLLKRFEEITLTNLTQHHILLGQRGMGKTSLLRRLALGVMEDPALNSLLLPLTFREEQYNVHNLHVFWCNCLDALGDWFEKTGQTEKANAIDVDVAKLSREKNDQDGGAALEVFKSWTKLEGKRPILFLDNIDIILNGLSKQQWGLRRILQESGGIVVVGASTSYMETMADKEAAFYDFFQVTVLEKLSHSDLMTCLRRLAELRGEEGRNVITAIDEAPGRIRTLYDLTGGNPRTLMLLYLLLELDDGGNVFSDLEKLLDQVTVLYKARVEDLSSQARVVLDALALEWNPINAAGIASTSGLSTSSVSTHLDRMCKDGLVEKANLSTTTRVAFQLSERFFNIWYLMRHAPRRQRTRLRWLTGFLRTFYTPSQLTDRAKDFLRVRDNQGQERQEYCLALSDAIDDPGWRNLLGFEAVSELERHAADDSGDEDAETQLLEIPTPVTAKDWLVQGRLQSRHLNRFEEAEGAYRKAVDLDPKWAAPWHALGDLLQYHLKRYEEAEGTYRKAIELDPKWAAPWSNLGRLLQYRLERYDAAEGAYRKAIELDSKKAYPWVALGNLLKNHLERYEEAEGAYRKAIELDPKKAAPWGNLGDLLQYRLERYDEAEGAYRKAIELEPKWAAPWSNLGRLLHYHFERYDEAEVAYRKAIGLDPKRVASWGNLGVLLQSRLERYEEAEGAYRKAIELDTKVAYPWGTLGDLLRNHLERHEEAEGAYRKAIELDPKWAAPWHALGDLLQYHLERYEEAEGAYRNAIELDPKKAGPRGGLGDLLQYHLKRYEEAEGTYRKAIELDPKWAAPWSNLGRLLQYRLERYDDAEGAYRKAIGLDSKRAYPWVALGNLLKNRLERYEESEGAYRKAIELDPKKAAPWGNLGDLLQYRLERYDEAEGAYRNAIELDPKKAFAWSVLGDLLQYRLERYEEAEEAYRRAIELESSVKTWKSLGDILLKRLDRVDEAMEAFRRAIKVPPEDSENWAALGYLLFYIFDRREEATCAYEKALKPESDDLATRSNLLALHLLDSNKVKGIDEEFEAVVAEHPASGAALLEALRAIARENFGEASSAFQRALFANDAELFGTYQGFFILFLRLATARGYGDKLLRDFDENGVKERYWPVYVALEAYVYGEERLTDVNPEVRGVAAHIYAWLDTARKAVPQIETLQPVG